MVHRHSPEQSHCSTPMPNIPLDVAGRYTKGHAQHMNRIRRAGYAQTSIPVSAIYTRYRKRGHHQLVCSQAGANTTTNSTTNTTTNATLRWTSRLRSWHDAQWESMWDILSVLSSLLQLLEIIYHILDCHSTTTIPTLPWK